MEKKTYYVSVQAGTLLEEEGAAAFEFEIEATEHDVERLAELFEDMKIVDEHSSVRAHLPVLQYHVDVENDAYDEKITEVYRELHRLGTASTKHHIERMGILEKKAMGEEDDVPENHSVSTNLHG